MDSFKYIVGRDGAVFTVADLPSPRTKRWVVRRKAEVVTTVLGGMISLDDACERYNLTREEFHSWQQSVEHFGLKGLRTTCRAVATPKLKWLKSRFGTFYS